MRVEVNILESGPSAPVTEETGGSSSSCHHCLHQEPDRGGRRTKREQLQESMS